MINAILFISEDSAIFSEYFLIEAISHMKMTSTVIKKIDKCTMYILNLIAKKSHSTWTERFFSIVSNHLYLIK